jgi:GMP synthase (glutamine-hydrolysing)
MQALAHAMGGRVKPSMGREYGFAHLHNLKSNPLVPEWIDKVWMSHGDRIEEMPVGFVTLAASDNSPIAVMGDLERRYYGVQFHPEVRHTPRGTDILRNFVLDICSANQEWTPESIITSSISKIRKQVGDARILSAVSGGVDSSVATALVHRAVGDQLIAIFVDTGLLRKDEALHVVNTFQQTLSMRLVTIDAVDQFMETLRGVHDPEEKRHIIGELFIRTFEVYATQLIQSGADAGLPIRFLVQGTIYPDVVESSAPDRAQASRIKTHHNVGGLPQIMNFELVEPLRYLFKDEVRAVGETLGLPPELVWRQPFPGPGLAVRCLGEVTPERLTRLRAADAIFTEELYAAGLLGMTDGMNDIAGTAQAFAVLLPVRSVGVMGDQRTYQETIALRAVTTEDFMTADWARIPYNLLARVSNRIINEVPGVNRVVYDITSKPPSTIEWE